jgi:hypothetical protein
MFGVDVKSTPSPTFSLFGVGYPSEHLLMISPLRLFLKLFHTWGSLMLWPTFKNPITTHEPKTPKYTKIVNVLWLHAYGCCLGVDASYNGSLL